MTPALKEWGAAVHALLAGRQTVLLRKGGIHEKRFAVGASRFLLFPTYVHTHAGSTRPEFAHLLAPGAADATPEALTIRAAAEVVAAIPVVRPDDIGALEPLHLWTTESVRRHRVDFRPRHRLTALVVHVTPLPAPVVLPRLPAYGGCVSWLELDLPLPVATPVPAGLRAVADRVRAAVG
ncbi:DUF1802 family protein [Nakamurella deserti]|uniref:DUF1802 family protein n=1 Tax=Nakamurella deserti TaxID=2164074 RepID=UPI000DBE7B77|nr:DUF1802 family protein [Nakamurella deserti]